MSTMPFKYTKAMCVTTDSIRQNLNNGRMCKNDYECKSK